MASVPVGYLFDPTDEELVGFYLYNKVSGNPLPSSCNGVMMECDLYGKKEPWEIWAEFGGTTEELYFFTMLKKISPKSSRYRRTVGKGTWKADTSDSVVFDRATNVGIGFKKILHYKRKGSSTSSSEDNNRWTMHEYRLDNSLLPQSQFKDCVLCRISKNIRTVNNNQDDNEYGEVVNDREINENLDTGLIANGEQHFYENPKFGLIANANDQQQINEYILPETETDAHDHQIEADGMITNFVESTLESPFCFDDEFGIIVNDQQIDENGDTGFGEQHFDENPTFGLIANAQQQMIEYILPEIDSHDQQIEADGMITNFVDFDESQFSIDDLFAGIEPSSGDMMLDTESEVLGSMVY